MIRNKKLNIILWSFDFSITSIILVIMAFYKNVIHDNFILGYIFVVYLYNINDFF